MTSEEHARRQIDAMLPSSGWVVQDCQAADFSAGRGIVLREVPLTTGPCDYHLLVDRSNFGEQLTEGAELARAFVGRVPPHGASALNAPNAASGDAAYNQPPAGVGPVPPHGGPLPVTYNPAVPIEKFDFIVTDECHRSIYNLWRQVLEYFDASLIGLTAAPAPQTIAYFHQNRVADSTSSEKTSAEGEARRVSAGSANRYNHEKAVADGVNVGSCNYPIKTQITEAGSKVEAGLWVDKRDRQKAGIDEIGVSLTHDKPSPLLIPLPPLAQQTRIVAEVERRLSVVEQLESVVSANLERATRLRQSILQKGFSGLLVENEG